MRPLVQRLGHVTLEVTDPQAMAADVAGIVGARVVGTEGDAVLISANARHAELVLHPSDRNALRACGLEAVSAEAVEAVAARAAAAGLPILSRRPSLPAIERSVTFATTEGHVFEVHAPMPQDRPARYIGAGAHPRCIDHVNFTAEDPARFVAEVSAACGLLLSERTSGHEISWLRAADGRHHTIAVVKGPSGVHHISWEFASFDDFRRLADALSVDDRRLVWGPGRHGAGDNLFLYYHDTAGFLIECIAEMEVILDDDRPARVVDPGEGLSNWKVVNQWGALPPRAWIEHFNPCAPFSASA